jgi:hypothetical protein
MAIIDTKTKYVWDYYLKTKDECYIYIREWLEQKIKPLRGRDLSTFEIILFSDMGEAHSEAVRETCAEYGVSRQTTAGYTPEHNAFIERWFRTNAEMSRCQMQQFDMEETFWEDSRRMATFIYNRVPPARRIPGKPWLSPAQQQYPDRPYMDMSRIQPFGLKCFVHQVKEKRNKGYSGKSDKKQNAVEGKVVGYDDLQGSLRVKVYYPATANSEWVDEQLVKYADPLDQLENKNLIVPAEDVPERDIEDFYPLLGTRHVDPDNGLTYETTDVFQDKRGYNLVYRRLVTKGRLEKHLDGPLHAADIESYTKVNLERCSDLTGLQDERTASPGIASARGRMDTSSSSGRSGTVHFPEVSNIENQTSSVRSDRKDTDEGRRESSSSRKSKSRTATKWTSGEDATKTRQTDTRIENRYQKG